MTTEEIWVDVKGYEGLYQISNLGRIRTLHLKRPRLMKLHRDKDGYAVVLLHKDGKVHNKRVGRLVAQAFIPNVARRATVNHKNLNKRDDRVENLEWMTVRQNISHYLGLKPRGD